MIEITEKQDETFEERSRNAARIFVISVLTTTLIGIYYSFGLYQRQTPWGYGESNVQAFFIAFASLLGYWLLKQKQLLTSVFIYLGVFSVAIAVSVLHFGGMDFILALIILLMYIGVAGATLPRQIAEGTIVGSIFLSVVVGFLGYWDPLGREFFPPDIIAYIAATFLIVIYGTFLGRQFRRYSLRTKLILAFAILSAAGIGVAFSVASFNMERVLSANSRQRLLAQAESSANDIDAFLQYSSDAVETASSYLDLRAYLLLSPKERIGTQTERQVQNILYALKNRNPDILSYGLLDLNGINIIDSRTANIGKSEASLIYFDVVMSSGSTYISNVLYPPAEKGGVFFIGTPVYNDMGVMVGILRAKYDAALLQDMLNIERVANPDRISVMLGNLTQVCGR